MPTSLQDRSIEATTAQGMLMTSTSVTTAVSLAPLQRVIGRIPQLTLSALNEKCCSNEAVALILLRSNGEDDRPSSLHQFGLP